MKKNGKFWWEMIPQCRVGDLVRNKNRRKKHSDRLFLVIKVNPKVPCRVHPVQHVLCADGHGLERWYSASTLEVINAHNN